MPELLPPCRPPDEDDPPPCEDPFPRPVPLPKPELLPPCCPPPDDKPPPDERPDEEPLEVEEPSDEDEELPPLFFLPKAPWAKGADANEAVSAAMPKQRTTMFI